MAMAAPLFSLFATLGVPQGANPPPLLLVRRGSCEYETLLHHYAVPYRASDSLQALETLLSDQTAAVVLCSLRYPEPNILTARQQQRLEQFVRTGGRALVEFSLGEAGPLFGVPVEAAPQRAFFERLYVVGDHPATAVLGRDVLLEEHNSAYLPCTPPEGTARLLDYGKVLGTYHVYRQQPGVEMVLDLLQPCRVARVVQRYGAGEPNYRPEQVEVAVSGDRREWHVLASVPGDPLLPAALDLAVEAVETRFLRFRVLKYRRSRQTDFLFLGETEVFDEAGRNVALGKPYSLTPPASGAYLDPGSLLTDGVVEAHWSDHLAPGWTVSDPLPDTFPGLLEVSYGEGQVLLALSKFSDFRARHYRLTARWEALLRGMLLHALPVDRRQRAQAHYLPLSAHSEPRRWAAPGEPVTLVVETEPGARIEVRGPGMVLPPGEADAEGRCRIPLSPPPGVHRFQVLAHARGRARETAVELEVSSRRERYRRALDANLEWFLKSGVLPEADGSRGVYSQRCLAWLDGGPWDGGPHDPLPSPFRVDCNLASAVAFGLYGEVSGEQRYFALARKVADSALPHQYDDPAKASFGGWRWLYEKSDAIFFWDDNTRDAVALLWLYGKSRDERYLEAALRTLELCRRVAMEDGCIARHVISGPDLDAIGRAAYRQTRQALAADFDLLRWFWAAGVTGDPIYEELARTCARTRGGQAGVRGLPFAVHATGDPALRERLLDWWSSYLANPDVQRWGVWRTGPADFQYAFVNDCSINTEAGEPLTDQIYTVPHLLLHAWWAYQATGDRRCLQAFEGIADYLVRIQYQGDEPALRGAWMRGFDLEAWEEYGAPYDPSYGPYSAYTGWMNAFAAAGLALYLLDAPPFPPTDLDRDAVRAVLQRVRAQEPPDRVRHENVARGCAYTLEPAPDPAYPDAGDELTDGVVDGPYQDGLSVGWRLSEEGHTVTVTMTLDLGRTRLVGMVGQRWGATGAAYTPDRVEVLVSEDGESFRPVAETQVGRSPVGSVWLALEPPATGRWVQFRATKTRRGPDSDFLFLGETFVLEAATP